MASAFAVVCGHCRPGAVELLGAARLRERLQRVHREPARVGLERGEPRRTAHMGDPGAGRDGRGDLRDRTVGHAQQDEIGLERVEGHTSLCEALAYRSADPPTRADDVDAVDHGGSSSVAGYRAPGGYPSRGWTRRAAREYRRARSWIANTATQLARRPAGRKLRRWWRVGGEVLRREGPGRLLVRSGTAVRGLVYRDVILVALDLSRDVPEVAAVVPVVMRLLGPERRRGVCTFPRRCPSSTSRRAAGWRSGDACIAAWVDDDIVSAGWYSFGTAWVDDVGRGLRLGPDEVFGYDLYTAEAHRGRGVASQRGRWAAAHLRAEGYRTLVAGISPQNLPVRGPTQKLGYDTLGRAGFVRLGPLRRDFVLPEGGARRWGRRADPIETERDFGRAPAA